MNWNSLFCGLIICSTVRGQIVLSEIMFNPEGNERYNEYVEIYKAGETETVDLNGWLLSDSSKFNIILPHQGHAQLKPHQYGLILGPNYFTESRSYDMFVPPDALLLTVNNAQLGAYGLNNSKGERISIHRPDETLVAAYKYTPDNSDGYSEEKIDLLAGDGPENWKNSLVKGGTPGSRNSVTPLTYDLALTAVMMTPTAPSSTDSLFFTLTLRNAGSSTVDGCTVIIEELGPNAKVLFRGSFSFELAVGDSMQQTAVLGPMVDGDYRLRLTAEYLADENPLNNSIDVEFSASSTLPSSSVVINEIMYNTDEKMQEWVELCNGGEVAVNLKGWSFADAKKTVVLSEQDAVIVPGGFAVIANQPPPRCDSSAVLILLSLPELNNSGDELSLRDAKNRLIDYLVYRPSMGGTRDRSLERIRIEVAADDPRNWGSCIDSSGSTAGRRNSLSPRDYDLAVDGNAVRQQPCAPLPGDMVQIIVPVYNAGCLPIDPSTVRLFHFDNHDERVLVDERTLAPLAVGDTLEVTLDWRAESSGKHSFEIGVVSSQDQQMINNLCTFAFFVSLSRGTIVINEIMYSPAPEMCEWVELYNCSQDSVDLQGWELSDSDTASCKTISRERRLAAPQGYMVLAKDSTFQPTATTEWIHVAALPSLANDVDAVVIFDANHVMQDRVDYHSSWGGARGRSLERIQPTVGASEPSNWMTCVDAEGNTMGRRNSVFVQDVPRQATLQAQPNPFSPDGDGFDDVTAVTFALPTLSARVNVRIFDAKGRPVRFLLNNELSGAERTVFWDGRNDEGERCRMGIYIIWLEALSESARSVNCRCTVVLAGRL